MSTPFLPSLVQEGDEAARFATRRQIVAGSLLASAALASSPLLARATEPGDADDSGTAEPETAEPTGSSSDAASASGASSSDGPVLLNEVAYPDPIASDDYDALLEVEDANPLDEDFLAGIEAFANSLACCGLSGSADPAAAQTGGSGAQGGSASGAPSSNACLSPASLYLALALLAQGAAGDTQTQLLDVLGMAGAGADALADQCSNLMRALWARTTPEGDPMPSTLQVANSVWLRADAPFEQGFLDTAAASFYAECYEVPAADAAAGEAMGAWIADHTGGTLEPDVKLADDWIASLVNTVWFKDGWIDPFNENDTAPGAFHAATGDVECDFMTVARTCAVGESAGCRVASLPLVTGAQVTFVLPEEGVDIRSLFARATGVGMLWTLDSLSSTMVDATFVVPKVSFDTTAKLAEVCRQMGVVDALDPELADLGALTPLPAWASSIDQGTHFAMDEHGVEASAYTVVGIAGMSAPIELEKVEFRLDRPFAFRLSSPQGIPLFVGIVDDPTQG